MKTKNNLRFTEKKNLLVRQSFHLSVSNLPTVNNFVYVIHMESIIAGIKFK